MSKARNADGAVDGIAMKTKSQHKISACSMAAGAVLLAAVLLASSSSRRLVGLKSFAGNQDAHGSSLSEKHETRAGRLATWRRWILLGVRGYLIWHGFDVLLLPWALGVETRLFRKMVKQPRKHGSPSHNHCYISCRGAHWSVCGSLVVGILKEAWGAYKSGTQGWENKDIEANLHGTSGGVTWQDCSWVCEKEIISHRHRFSGGSAQDG